MPYHHLALAVKDMKAIHAFYTEAMGFQLARAERVKTPTGGLGFHYFYDAGGGEFMAFWQLDDKKLPSDFPTSLSGAAGLPHWVNHLAFKGRDLAHLDETAARWRKMGLDVMDLDHHWCRSIYTFDPNGTMVELCVTTIEANEKDRQAALDALEGREIAFAAPPGVNSMFKGPPR